MEKIRTFIAFKISDKAKEELQDVQEQLRKINKRAHVTWSKPRGFHVTLQFLGEIESHQVEEIKKVLSNLSREFHQFSYWLEDLDAFPNKAHPNVIIAQVGEEHRVSTVFQEKLVQELKKINLVHDSKPWYPHVTLGRNKTHQRIDGFETVRIQPVVWQVDSVELIKSDLEPGGPRYTVLKSFTLDKM